MKRGPKRRIALLICTILALVVVAMLISSDSGPTNSSSGARADFATNDPLRRACDLPQELLMRIWRGHDPTRSEDVTIVPRAPNFIGSFEITSHSGPWDYLQQIPLVLYGPGHIASSSGGVDRAVDLADIYPTVARLLDFDVPRRDGDPLEEALIPHADTPNLIVTVVWDGVGKTTLEKWPGRWPNLERLTEEGTSYSAATVGSSPSITPASHATIGTGFYPRHHRVTAIDMRTEKGEVVTTFAGRSLGALAAETFSDRFDRELGNTPRVGLMGWNPWHIAMMGRGSLTPGGDRDQLGLIDYEHPGKIEGGSDFYSDIPYLLDYEGFDAHASRLDRSDGRIDGRWLGTEIVDKGGNPAWVEHQTDAVIDLWRRDRYGRDEVPDLFFVNFYSSDVAGHYSTIDSEQSAAVLEAQDEALGRMLDYLDREIRDYVVLVTADHGHTASPAQSDAWPINQRELIADINGNFDVPSDASLIEESAAFGYYLDRAELQRLDVNATDIARFVNAYTLTENVGEDDIPAEYERRSREQLFSAAFPSARLGQIMRCAFGEAPGRS